MNMLVEQVGQIYPRSVTNTTHTQTANLIRVNGRSVSYQPAAPFTALHHEDVEMHQAQRDVLAQIDEYFGHVCENMYDEPELQNELLMRLQTAKERTLQATEQPAETDPAALLGRAQLHVRRVHIAIARTQRSREAEQHMRLWVPILFLIYIALIIGTIVCVGITQKRVPVATGQPPLVLLPVIQVPLSVLIWAALGSVAAILYRFYTVKQGPVADEIRWLIARPIIGIIMGALTYVAIASGLFILGSAIDSDKTTPNPHLLWVIAFFGGFSDRFFGTLIETVMGYLPHREPQVEEVSAQETAVVVKQATVQLQDDEMEAPLPASTDDNLPATDPPTEQKP